MNSYLKKEDYEEPRCPLNMKCDVPSVPVGRVIEKLDEYLGRNDYSAGLRHLEYWVAEADSSGDKRAKLTLLNETAGLCRKIGNEEKGMAAVDALVKLIEELGVERTVSGATSYLNAATALKAFGQTERAIELYSRVLPVYETLLEKEDSRLAAFYNNFAISLVDVEDYNVAEEFFNKALKIVENKENGKLEQAMTYLNLADLKASQKGLEDACEDIENYLTKAENLLFSESVEHNSYYAFVADKCAPSFDYYGYFLTAQKLKKLSEEIYERA